MIDTPVTPDLLHGAAEVETTARGLRPHRLPAWVRRQFPDGQLLGMEVQPAGVRLEVATTARTLEVVVHPQRIAYVGADRPRGALDLVVDGVLVASDVLTGGDAVEVDLRTGATAFAAGAAHTATFADLPAGEKRLEVWLPHNEQVELVGLRADAPVRAVASTRPRWVHYGSSISQGSNAATPAGTWPAVAARLGGADLRNLGFGGSAVVDPFVARVVRDTPADLISVKVGINVVNLDAMRLRAFVPAVHGFLDTIRDGHPDVPLVLVSPLFCGIHEDAPGPGVIDPASIGTDQIRFGAAEGADLAHGRLTLRVIREALADLVERRADDPHLHLLDGLGLYGAADAETHPLPDALHPDPATHRLIGERFAGWAFGAGGAFAGTRAG